MGFFDRFRGQGLTSTQDSKTGTAANNDEGEGRVVALDVRKALREELEQARKTPGNEVEVAGLEAALIELDKPKTKAQDIGNQGTLGNASRVKEAFTVAEKKEEAERLRIVRMAESMVEGKKGQEDEMAKALKRILDIYSADETQDFRLGYSFQNLNEVTHAFRESGLFSAKEGFEKILGKVEVVLPEVLVAGKMRKVVVSFEVGQSGYSTGLIFEKATIKLGD